MLTFAPQLRQSTAAERPRPRLDTTDMPDVTRQEFRDEANVNVILSKFGVNSLTNRVPIYTETNYNLDLQQAIATIETVRNGWQQLPQEIRDRYPDWRVVVQLLQEGHEPKELRDLLKPKEPTNGNTGTERERSANPPGPEGTGRSDQG